MSATSFDVAPPALELGDLAALADTHFGVSGEIRPLASERDQNAHIHCADGREYVLKITNAAEDPDFLDMQNAALRHLADVSPGLGVPHLCPTRDGAPMATVDQGLNRVRLLTYLPGPLLKDVPKTSQLLRSLGTFMGGVDQAFQGFMHSAALRPDFLWNLDNAPACIDFVAAIADPGDRALVAAVFERYEHVVQPRLSGLRCAVIHQDANDYNVIVDSADAERVAGLIDFGDMVWGRQVNEVAVTLAYALLDHEDPLAAAGQVVAGYNEAFPLSDNELAVLFDLVAMRLAMSVCISSHRSREHPGNEYLLVSQRPALDLLRRLAAINPDFAHFALRAACGRPAVPNGPKIAAWLGDNRSRFASVLGMDLKTARKAYLPMTAGASGVENAADPAAYSAFLADFLSRNDAELAIGGYGEQRAVYLGPQFAPTDGKEARTVHLGIDLFGAERQPVFAPLAGRVVSAADNAAPCDYGPTIILEHETTDDGPQFWTLYGHLSRDSLDGLAPGDEIAPGQRIGRFGFSEENGGWPPHLHFQVMTDLMGMTGNFPGVGEPGRMNAWSAICLDPNLILGLPPEALGESAPRPESLRAVRQERLGPSLSLSYAEPLEIVRGEGTWLFDHRGRAFLDCVNNICHVGHCHPRVVDALARQAAVLNTNTRYLHETIIEYAGRLAAAMPDPLEVCYFVCSGSEANELAVRLARAHTGRTDAIVLDGAYHGNTTTLVDLSPYKCEGPGGEGLKPFVHKAPMPDPYRGPHRGMTAATGAAYAANVANLVDRMTAAGGPPAFLIAESLLSCGGQIELPPGFLEGAYAAVRAAGGVCIADEVQVGFGRVGSHMWGYQTQDVVPDIVSLGKPMGNGHPLACVVTTAEIARSFANGMEYFNSYGGNPVSCAVGMAVLDVIEEDGLQENARIVGEHLTARLHALGDRHPLVGDVRGRGLFIGVELVRDRGTLAPATAEAKQIINRAKARGVLLSTDGPFDNVIKIKPPIVFTRDNADLLADTLDSVLDGLD